MSRGFGRELRVGAQIHRLLTELLRSEVKDPCLASVQITEVDLSGDLGVAKVYFSTLVPDDDPEPVLEAFERAHGFLRSRVGQALNLRRVPELRFYHDASVKRGFEISQLIDASKRSTED
jgi:ribosome-binding factor A